MGDAHGGDRARRRDDAAGHRRVLRDQPPDGPDAARVFRAGDVDRIREHVARWRSVDQTHETAPQHRAGVIGPDGGLTDLRGREECRPRRAATERGRVRYSSRCTVAGENAGTHTAMYSAPSGSGVL